MTAVKTIFDRGLTTFTRPEPLTFSFDRTTRQLELVQYLAFCTRHGLITTAGEQSRLLLIKKVFNYLGGAGVTAEDAMRDWLQDQTGTHFLTTADPLPWMGLVDFYSGKEEAYFFGPQAPGANSPNGESAIDKLWKIYFAQHAATPDLQGVTYAGLSLEAGYRKWLLQFLSSDNSVAQYNDSAAVQEIVNKKFTKILSEGMGASEIVAQVLTKIGAFSEESNVTESVLMSLTRLIAEGIAGAETFAITFAKKIAEGIAAAETVSTTGGLTGVTRPATDAPTAAETFVLTIGKIIAAEVMGASEAIVLNPRLIFSEGIGASETVAGELTIVPIEGDFVESIVAGNELVTFEKFESLVIDADAWLGATDFYSANNNAFFFGM